MVRDGPRVEFWTVTKAPWSAEEVAALNAFQAAGQFHPLTCGLEHDDHDPIPMRAPDNVLVATPDGWRCPHYGCKYTQDWAPAFMFEPIE